MVEPEHYGLVVFVEQVSPCVYVLVESDNDSIIHQDGSLRRDGPF